MTCVRSRVLVALLLGTCGALGLDPPAVLLHLSDVHLSTNVAMNWRAFGDREGDLEMFAQKLLPLISPQATMITGDLTDAKNEIGAGVQQEEEWQAYRRILDTFASAGGVPESSILDLRGNHDVFNMPLRGGANDFFSRYAAQGRRTPPGKRVFSYLLPPTPLVAAAGAEGSSSGSGDKGSRQSVGASETGEAGARRRRWLMGVGGGGQGGECPSVALMGIDSTPEPGLRSPANFAGVGTMALLQDTREELDSILSSTPPSCPRPLIVAYGHYPLSTTDYPTHVAGPLGMLMHISRSALSMQGLTQLLADYNVSSYLNGHLHAAFGHRLHRMHPTSAGGYLAELETAAWKDDRRFRILAADGSALSFSDLFFHTPSSPRRERRREDAMATKENAWREAYQQRGYAVTSADPTAEVIHHVALITWPPDARYSPLAPGALQHPLQHPLQGEQGSSQAQLEGEDGSLQSSASGDAASRGRRLQDAGGNLAEEEGDWRGGLVRALVFPLDGQAAAAPEAWEVALLSWLPGGSQFAPPTPLELQLSAAGMPGGLQGAQLFQATLLAELNCSSAAGGCGEKGGSKAARRPDGTACAPPTDHIFIQVQVRGRDGHVSSSPAQPVGLRCSPLPGLDGEACRQQRCVPAPAQAPLPLGNSRLEWFTLLVNWPVLVHRLFLLVWAGHIGVLLLVPRMLCSKWGPRICASPLFRPQSAALLATNPPSSGSAPTQPPVWQVARGWGLAVLQGAGALVVWPAASLVLLASEPATWTALVVNMMYLVAGPWYLAELLSGYPRALLFHFGVLLPPAKGSSWRFIATCDTMFISLVHMLFCVLPITLWVACVVGRRQLVRAQGAGSSRPSSSSATSLASSGDGNGSGSRASLVLSKLRVFSVPQWLGLAGIAALNWAGAYDKAAKLNGTLAVVVSPGFAWTIPLAVLLVLWPQLPRQRSACMGKRE